ncbi:MAG: hypothetical protein OXC19_01680 [Bryobacterales bacterium]|nr:hypothetical protein [Bryobacterales bacterium]
MLDQHCIAETLSRSEAVETLYVEAARRHYQAAAESDYERAATLARGVLDRMANETAQ